MNLLEHAAMISFHSIESTYWWICSILNTREHLCPTRIHYGKPKTPKAANKNQMTLQNSRWCKISSEMDVDRRSFVIIQSVYGNYVTIMVMWGMEMDGEDLYLCRKHHKCLRNKQIGKPWAQLPRILLKYETLLWVFGYINKVMQIGWIDINVSWTRIMNTKVGGEIPMRITFHSPLTTHILAELNPFAVPNKVFNRSFVDRSQLTNLFWHKFGISHRSCQNALPTAFPIAMYFCDQ